MAETTYRIKNWSKHQHFKDRTPPWIKLYREILDDPDWHELDGDDAKTLVSLWLIASEDTTHTGVLPCARKLAFRLRIAETKLKQKLIKLSHWLVQDDIKTISTGYQVDAPERAGEETETETETETESFGQEGERETETELCGELENTPSSPPPPVITIPLVGRDGEYCVGKDLVLELASLFPAVDVIQELRKIRAWNLSHPKNRKTKAGISRHITGWLGSAQDRAGERTSSGHRKRYVDEKEQQARRLLGLRDGEEIVGFIEERDGQGRDRKLERDLPRAARADATGLSDGKILPTVP